MRASIWKVWFLDWGAWSDFDLSAWENRLPLLSSSGPKIFGLQNVQILGRDEGRETQISWGTFEHSCEPTGCMFCWWVFNTESTRKDENMDEANAWPGAPSSISCLFNDCVCGCFKHSSNGSLHAGLIDKQQRLQALSWGAQVESLWWLRQELLLGTWRWVRLLKRKC